MHSGRRRGPLGHSLRAKIILWFVLPTALVLGTVAIVAFYASQRVTEALVFERNRDRTQLLANQFSAELRKLTQVLDSMGMLPGLFDLSPTALEAAWQEQGWQTFDAGVLLLDRSGQVARAVPLEHAPLTGHDWSDLAYAPSARPTVTARFSNIIPSEGLGTGFIAMARPVWSSADQLEGTIIGLLRIERGVTRISAFYQSIWSLYIGRRETAYLLDANGRVIFHPDTFLIGDDWSGQEATALALSGEVGALHTDNQEGKETVTAFAPVPDTSWVLLTEEDWRELLRPSRTYSWLMLILLALGVILPVGVVALGVRRITEPIAHLTRAAQAVAHGRFEPIEVDTGDEIEILAEQFNAMAAEISTSYATLEQRVALRTQELAALNAVAEVVSRSLDLERVLGNALEKTSEVMGLEAGAAFRLEAGAQNLTLMASRGLSPSFVERVRSLPLGISAAARAAETQRPATQLVVDYPEGEWKDAIAGEGLRLVVSVPLIAKGATLGVINLATRTARELSTEEMSLLASIGQQVGVAMDNARLYEEAEEQATVAERNRLARDLHDAISQTLFSASLIADVLPRLWERNQDVARKQLLSLRQLTRGAMAEMRTLLLELRPSALPEAELPELLRQLGNAAAGRAQLAVDVEAAPVDGLPPDVKLGLYRIAQEALNNVAKHAHARHVMLSLQCGEPEARREGSPVSLSIVDDGCGFDPGDTPADHFGLRNMRERAEAIGADLRVQSQPGEGTSVLVVWREKDGGTAGDSSDAG